MLSVSPRSLLAVAVFAALLVTGTTGSCTPERSAGRATAGTDTHGWSGPQLANARLIVEVGQRMGVPAYGQQIALATAIQESGLRNLPGGPDDSAGLFQQRPSQGWGSYAQVTTPEYAAGRFYAALLAVPGWRDRPLYEAAQAVQRSCCPRLYQRWADAAYELFAVITGDR